MIDFDAYKCQCHQIGGPFIEEDPECPVHQRGGLQDQVNDLECQVSALKGNLESLKKFGIHCLTDAEHLKTQHDKFKAQNMEARGLLRRIYVDASLSPDLRKAARQVLGDD